MSAFVWLAVCVLCQWDAAACSLQQECDRADKPRELGCFVLSCISWLVPAAGG